MFSVEQKKHLAAVIEKTILEFNHPEMPKENPVFMLHVEGTHMMSWAEIKPNWIFDEKNKPGVNPFNEREEVAGAWKGVKA